MVSWLFTMGVSGHEERGDLEKLIEGYAFVLRGQPAWALKAACVQAARAKKFRPVPAELWDLAEAATRAARAEFAEILAVLTAEIEAEPWRDETAEHRAAVVAKWRARLKSPAPEAAG